MNTGNFCFYLQNRLIQTSQTGGQQYNDTSPFSIPWSVYENTLRGPRRKVTSVYRSKLRSCKQSFREMERLERKPKFERFLTEETFHHGPVL
jgi:hypothetical protein